MLSRMTVSSKLLPSVQQLVTDASEHVRASLASVINNLATSLGKEETVERLLPIILLLLRDEVSEVSYYCQLIPQPVSP
jgi:serine/threonine-protein phosphatase 2A regulatory subunit A